DGPLRLGELQGKRIARGEARYGGRVELVLAVEVVIEAAAGQARAAHDLVDGDLLEAVTVEQAARGLDDPTADAILVFGGVRQGGFSSRRLTVDGKLCS